MRKWKQRIQFWFDYIENKWVRFFSGQNIDIYRRIFRKMFFFSILSAVIAGIIILIVLSVYRIAAPKTKVPSVKSLEIFDAVRTLQERGLVIDIETKFDPGTPRYIVLDQFPQPGITVRQGRRVKILVSMGKDTYTVPLLVGKSRADAERLLVQLNIPYEVTVIQSDRHALNAVVSQNKRENAIVDRKEKLTIVVNSDIRSTEARVPNLLGRNIDTAAREAISAGFAVRLLPFLTADEAKEGVIIAQSLEANTIIPRNTDLTLEVGIYDRDPSSSEMRYHVITHHVRTMGESEQAEASVMIMMIDDNATPLQLFNSTVPINQLIVIPFKARGTATIQVFVDNSLIREETYVP